MIMSIIVLAGWIFIGLLQLSTHKEIDKWQYGVLWVAHIFLLIRNIPSQM